jgi:germacradienol/geosmin synthase
MPTDPSPTLVALNPVEHGLADLWARTAPTMAEGVRTRFPPRVLAFVGSWLWELANLVEDRVPDPVDYVEMRRTTAAAVFSTDLLQSAMGLDLPSGLLATRPIRTLLNAFADIGALRNDILSYEKEVDREDEINNGVHAVQQFLGTNLQQAVDIVNDLATSKLRQFEHIIAAELPALLEDSGLEKHVRASLAAYVEALRDWMAGEARWEQRTGRYTRLDQQPGPIFDLSSDPMGGSGAGWHDRPASGQPLGCPAGPGTSAARIGSLSAAGAAPAAALAPGS